MNTWLIAACAMTLGIVPCGWVCVHGTVMDRLAALEMASLMIVLIMVLLAEGFARPSLYDLALALALLAFPSGLVFANFLERWL